MRIAIVHEWLTTFAGSEKVLAEMLGVFPEADLFAVVDFLDDRTRRRQLGGRRARTTLIQKLPRARSKYRSYLPLMPLAIEQLDVSGYDLVISNNHAVAKGVITGPDQLHVCLCHSPIRYAWDLQHQYLSGAGLDRGLRSLAVRWLLHRMRNWDARSANGVDRFIAISRFVAGRIRKAYRRESTVLNSPIDVDRFRPGGSKEDFYLAVSRMVPYKRTDLLVRAFADMPSRRLIVIGDGPEMHRVRRAARGAGNVELLGAIDDQAVVDHMQRARGLVFAAEEDLGLVPLEAMACGTPVVALAKGGARETVIHGETGVLFSQPDESSIRQGVEHLENILDSLDVQQLRSHAEHFSCARWRERFEKIVLRSWDEFRERRGILDVQT
jgi:glycosyltransferase involved in cell wall biosynthesis